MKRRLDFWTSVSRVDFTYRWGRLSVTPQYKFMLVRLRDHTASRNSFKRRTTFVTVTNRTDYFGYELVTILGVHEARGSTTPSSRTCAIFDRLTLFVRALVGFTEFGRPI